MLVTVPPPQTPEPGGDTLLTVGPALARTPAGRQQGYAPQRQQAGGGEGARARGPDRCRHSNGLTSVTSAPYYYVGAPTLISISPTSGSTAGGTVVTLTGSDFQGGTGACDITGVNFGATAVPANQLPTTCSDNSATVAAPPSSAGAAVVQVTTDGGTTSGTGTPGNTFTYNTPSHPPTVGSVSPAVGSSGGGDSVTLGGTNFFGGTASCAVTQVLFGSVADTEPTTGWPAGTNCSNTSFTVTSTPAAPCGTVDVRVVTSVGESAVNAPSDHFTYLATQIPCVSGVAPARGPESGGTAVTISGSGFQSTSPVTGVSFGSVAATTWKAINDTTIDATAPAQSSAGAVDVTVANANGTSVTSAEDQFTAVAAPTVSSISPTQGPGSGGTEVTINGSGFDGGTNACDVQSVAFGSGMAALPPISCSHSAVTVNSPVDAGGGTVAVTVTTTGGSSTVTSLPPGSDSYTYVAEPVVSSLSPTSGPLTGGTSVTITGSGFFADKGSCNVTQVMFGSSPAGAPTSCASDTSITVTAPAGAQAGSVDVRVTTGDGGTSPANPNDLYTFVAPSAWQLEPGSANDVAAGQVFVLGTNTVPGGYGIYFWTGSGWVSFPGGGTVIAVDASSHPWVTNSANEIYGWTGSNWVRQPGSARYVAAGADGSVYVLGTNAVPGGYGVWKWNPGSGSWSSVEVWSTSRSARTVRSGASTGGTPSTTGQHRRLEPGARQRHRHGRREPGQRLRDRQQPGARGRRDLGLERRQLGSLPGGGVDLAVDSANGTLWTINSSHAVYSFS